MDKLKLELGVLLPENGECERCVTRLETSLQQHRGVEQAHVDRQGPTPQLCLHYNPELIALAEIERRAREAGAVVQARYHHRELEVVGMDCADCATRLEQGVARLDGVLFCSVNFGSAKMRVEYDAERLQPEAVGRRVRKMGWDVRESGARDAGVIPGSARAPAPGGRLARFSAHLRSRPRDLLTLLSGLLLVSALALEVGQVGAPWTTSAVLALSVIVGGYHVFRKGLVNLWITRQLDMNFLMTIAVLGAAAIGEWTEAALVVFLFSLGETLESYTMDRARNSIRSLMQLSPAEATLIEACIDCAEHIGRLLPDGHAYASGVCPWCIDERAVPVGELEVGDRILVKPGERIAMDGLVRSGASTVNQAPITGESVPVEKPLGSEVYAGSINGAGALEVEVTRLAADNTISRIIHMVEEAQARKAPSQRWVDVFARYYTPAVVALAVLVAIVPPLLFGQPFLDPTGAGAVALSGGQGWLYRALALLIAACPCALVISTPVSIVSGISRAAQLGVLIKGGAYLEAVAGLKAIAFDKTGTLTRGEPVVTHVVSLNGAGEEAVLQVAAGIEARSEHPLARAVVSEAEARSLAYRPAEAFRAMVGRGAVGLVHGQAARVGSLALFADAGIAVPPAAAASAAQLEQAGNTVMLVHGAAAPGREPEMLGLVAVADTIRPDAPAATAALKAAGIRQTVMLTGDNERTARAIARQTGVDDVRANLLPDGKVQAIAGLLDEFGRVAMVGDGVNDAPALARATVGIAMGGAATDQALETADVVLMGDDLLKLRVAVRLSRQTLAVLRQNIAFSLLVKAAFIVLVLGGAATLWMAVLADVGTTLVVIANGMRLLRAEARA